MTEQFTVLAATQTITMRYTSDVRPRRGATDEMRARCSGGGSAGHLAPLATGAPGWHDDF